MDYKKSKAPVNTVTRNIMDLCDQTGNIYESVAIISKRSNQISAEIKQKKAGAGSTGSAPVLCSAKKRRLTCPSCEH